MDTFSSSDCIPSNDRMICGYTSEDSPVELQANILIQDLGNTKQNHYPHDYDDRQTIRELYLLGGDYVELGGRWKYITTYPLCSLITSAVCTDHLQETSEIHIVYLQWNGHINSKCSVRCSHLVCSSGI